MFAVSVGLIHPTSLCRREQSKPRVLVNWQLANENVVLSVLGMNPYVPLWHHGCSSFGTRARAHGETEAQSEGRQTLA